MIIWDGIHTGADLVTQDGCEGMKRSHAADGERLAIRRTYRNVIASSCRTQSFWTFAIYLRQLVDIFAAPPKLWETSDVITTTYINQLRGLMGCGSFTFNLCRSTDVQLTCARVSAAHTPSIKQDWGHVLSCTKPLFFHDGSNLKI